MYSFKISKLIWNGWYFYWTTKIWIKLEPRSTLIFLDISELTILQPESKTKKTEMDQNFVDIQMVLISCIIYTQNQKKFIQTEYPNAYAQFSKMWAQDYLATILLQTSLYQMWVMNENPTFMPMYTAVVLASILISIKYK